MLKFNFTRGSLKPGIGENFVLLLLYFGFLIYAGYYFLEWSTTNKEGKQSAKMAANVKTELDQLKTQLKDLTVRVSGKESSLNEIKEISEVLRGFQVVWSPIFLELEKLFNPLGPAKLVMESISFYRKGEELWVKITGNYPQPGDMPLVTLIQLLMELTKNQLFFDGNLVQQEVISAGEGKKTLRFEISAGVRI